MINPNKAAEAGQGEERKEEDERRRRELERPMLGLRRDNVEDERRRRNERAKELRAKNRLKRSGFR